MIAHQVDLFTDAAQYFAFHSRTREDLAGLTHDKS